MADKYHSNTTERIESIIYSPNLQDSGDLEASTKTITATSKPGTPDYTAGLTTDSPPDSRVIVTRLCQRLLIHIDSFNGGATKLLYSVTVNGTERASGEFTSAGADNAKSWDLTTGQFNLGSANTINVYLWVDAGNAVISVCQLWQAVGYSGTSYASALELDFCGFVSCLIEVAGVGSGTPSARICPREVPVLGGNPYYAMAQGIYGVASATAIAKTGLEITYHSTAANDIAYSRMFLFYPRSEQ
jgi:hypothetical protein